MMRINRRGKVVISTLPTPVLPGSGSKGPNAMRSSQPQGRPCVLFALSFYPYIEALSISFALLHSSRRQHSPQRGERAVHTARP